MLPLLTALALADIAPDPGYVETCTIAIQCGPGVEGRTCRGVGPENPPEPECDALAQQGWTRMCAGWGGTVYTVVMCKPAPDPAGVKAREEAATQKALPRARRCGTVEGGGLVGLVAALLVFVRARRSSSRSA